MPKTPSIALPKYVQRIISGGREYFYFQRGRGSASSGPRVKLPHGPHDAEFWAAYKSCLGSEVPSARTFDALISAYKIAPEFTKRAAATQRDYSRYLDIVSTAWGQLHVGSVRPKHVLQLRDAWAETPVAANHLLSVLKTLINWGIPREFSETNPCIHVPKLEVNEGGARPWPLWAYNLVTEHASEDMLRAVLLAQYTGQRQEDVLMMAPEHIEDGGISVVQQKTGKELWLPLHRDLKAALEGWSGSPFVLTPRGKPYTPDSFRAAWTRLIEGQHLRNVGLLACLACIDVDERLTVRIQHLEATGYLLDRPGRWETACHRSFSPNGNSIACSAGVQHRFTVRQRSVLN